MSTATATEPHMLPPHLRSLPADRLTLSEYVRQQWTVTPLPATPFSRLLEPDFFALRGRDLHKNDVITVIDEAGTYYAELLVVECGKTFARTALLRKVDLPAAAASDDTILPAGTSIAWQGPAELWACLRGTQTLRSGFTSRSEASDFLVNSLGRAGVV